MIGGTPPMSAIKFVLYPALTLRSQPMFGLSSTRASARISTPRFTTAPRFSNRETLAPADGGRMRAIRASLVRLL